MFVRICGFVLCLSVMILGNTYYIDYSGGSDANTGTAKTAPWKKCPGMNGFAAVYAHAPGDVFIFKGGVTWPAAALPFTIANSGAAGKTDVYTTDHSWYAGSAWAQPTLDGQLFGKTLLSASGTSHLKINDLRLVNAGLVAANDVIAFQFINCSFLELSNNTLAPESWGSLYISAEKSGDYNDIFVHHNDISHCAFAIRIVPAAPASIMHNVLIYNNSIHDFHSQLSGAVHGDGIQHYCSPDVAASYDRYIDGFKIYNNRFYGDFSQVSGSGGAMTALIYLSGASTGVQIYNNVFAPRYSGSQSPNFFESFISLRDNPNRGGHHKIYNNTFVTPVANGQAAAILEDDTRYPSPALDIKNNIFSNFDWPFDLRSTNHTIDYNNDHFVRDIGKWAGSFVGSFARWQALGLDVHGQSIAPGFVSATDQHLAAGSPCIAKGVNLSTTFTTDIEGNARPASAGYSLGAYEFGAAPPPPPPALPSTTTLWWPGNGATGVVVNPSLTWSPDAGATSYAVQVSAVSTFATTIINQTGITTNEYEANGLSNNTAYYWRVNATKQTGVTGWSSSGTFTTIAGVPAVAALSSPLSGSTAVATNPVLSWNAVPNAVSYAVQVSTASGFTSMVVNQTGVAATSLRVNGLLNSTPYYWRVSAVNAVGAGGWSLSSKFTTAAGVASPTLVLWWPGNKAKNVVLNPSLTWSPDPGALSYSLQVSTDSVFSKILMTQGGITTTSYEVNGLAAYSVYFWRVCVTKSGGTSGWSAARKFTTGVSLGKGATSALNAAVRPVSYALGIGAFRHGMVQISLPSSGAYRLAVYSLSGRQAGLIVEGAGFAGQNQVSLENLNIPQGMYTVRLSMNGAAIQKNMRVFR